MRVQKVGGHLGAAIDQIQLADVVASQSLQQQLLGLLNEHEVLFFRDQAAPAPVFAEFARCFGEVQGHPAYGTAPDAPDVQILESTPQVQSKIEVWHSDMTFAQAPPSYTFLHGQVIPEVGGDTLWASATAAFAALSMPMQNMLRPLRAIHDFRHGFRESLAEPGGRERLASAVAANPPVVHPLVRIHPQTRRPALYVNALFTCAIEGLSANESRALLEFLYQHIVTPEFTVRLQWQPGTIAIWDNRSTQHKPVNDYFPAARKLHRVTIAGENVMEEQQRLGACGIAHE